MPALTSHPAQLAKHPSSELLIPIFRDITGTDNIGHFRIQVWSHLASVLKFGDLKGGGCFWTQVSISFPSGLAFVLIHRHVSCRLGSLHWYKSHESVYWVTTVVPAIIHSHSGNPFNSSNYSSNHSNTQKWFTLLKSQKVLACSVIKWFRTRKRSVK